MYIFLIILVGNSFKDGLSVNLEAMQAMQKMLASLERHTEEARTWHGNAESSPSTGVENRRKPQNVVGTQIGHRRAPSRVLIL